MLSAAATATPVVTETRQGEDGVACVDYQYEYQDLAEQRESRLVFEALDEHQGKTIRNVRFVSRAIFNEDNPEEDNWLYRGFNNLHVNTHESVIAGQILFAEGEPLRRRLVEESERLLRTRNYLTSAYIVPDLVCPDYIDLAVITRDAWVTEPEFTVTREGGETESGFGLKDGNFLGTGDAIAVRYEDDVDRSRVSFEYETHHLLGTRLAARVLYAQKSDGEDTALRLERPFYALDTPWAAGGFLTDVSEVVTIRSAGEVVNEFRQRNRDRELYAGLATHTDERFTRRALVGISREEDVFSATDETVLGVPAERKGNYAWLGMEVVERRFETYKNLNQIQRTEDVALGVNYQFRVGYGGSYLGNERDLIRYRADYSNVIDVGDHHILRLNGELDGRHYKGPDSVDSGVVGLEANYNWFRDDQNRWFLGVEVGAGENLQQYEQLTLGGTNGLRGYPIDYQRGDRRYLINIERRYFSDWHLFNVVRMGGLAFIDAGRVWGDDVDARDNRHLSNVGLGLRFSSSKTKVGNVLHIDVATPLVDRNRVDSVQVTVKAERQF